MNLRRRAAAAGVVVAVAATAPYAVAAWMSTGTGNAAVAATSVQRVPAAPTVATSGPVATITWAATTLADGSAVGGYRVLRHVGTTVTTVCSTSAPTMLSCDDPTPSTSTARYGVLAFKGAWSGAESPLSDAFQFDTTAPTLSFSRTPDAPDTTWTSGDVAVTLSATDAGSGVKEIGYSLNGAAGAAVTGASAQLTVSREDANTLTFWAVDRAGNVSDTSATRSVRVDRTAPVVKAIVEGTRVAGYYTSAPTLTLNAQDTSPVGGAASGVATVEYQLRLDGGSYGAWTTYTGPITLSADGTHAVSYRARDLAGNLSAAPASPLVLVVDRTVPTFAPAVSGTAGSNGYYRSSPAPVLRLNAVDATSGLASVQYRIGTSGAWTAYDAAGITVPESASFTVYYRATDRAGNATADLGPQSVSYDGTAPATPTAVVNPASAATSWYTTSPTVTLSGGADSTGGSGLDRLEYQLGTAGAWTQYAGPVTVPDSSSVTVVSFRSVDRAGNVSPAGSVDVTRTDTVAPTITALPADGTSFGNNQWKSSTSACSPTGGNPGSARLCASASDATSGVDTTAAVTYTLVRLSGPNGTVTGCFNGSTVVSPATGCPTGISMPFAGGRFASAAITTTTLAPTGDLYHYRWTVAGVRDAAGNQTPTQAYTFSLRG